MLNWLRPQASTPQPAPPDRSDTPTQILQHCKTPTTLGDLSDRTGLSYRDLSALLKPLITRRQLRLVFLPIGSLYCVHYFTDSTHHEQPPT